MQKVEKICFVLLILVIFVSSSLFAQTRTIVTLGGSWWNAAYTMEDQDGEKLGDIGSGNNFGPYMSVNHGKVNFGLSVLVGKFPINEYGGYSLEGTGVEADMGRTDVNFTLGYRIHRNVNIFAGVKYLKWSMDMEYKNEYYDYSYKYEISESGPMYGLGLSLVLPLGNSGLYAFGSLAGMGGTLTYEEKEDDSSLSKTSSEDDSENDISAVLVALNVGLGYRFPSGLGINAGYRADLFSEQYDEPVIIDEKEVEPRIKVAGFMATISYSF